MTGSHLGATGSYELLGATVFVARHKPMYSGGLITRRQEEGAAAVWGASLTLIAPPFLIRRYARTELPSSFCLL